MSQKIKSSVKIQVLSENLANKIAAGEVVERPASVVKELIENAIDAGAEHIDIFIEGGGKKLIQLVDNGSGIGENDLLLAFERHATSKIHLEKDLERIMTLGFRGEALPSIASVSQVEIKTKTVEAKIGVICQINGGTVSKVTKTAANTGTSISVRNLFFNTPARRKFLRSDSTENQQILQILKRFFLAYPKIEFQLSIDSRQIFFLKSCNLDERVKEIYSTEIFEKLLSLHNSLGGIEINGFISAPDAARKSRTQQHLFLNGRPIQDKNINYAIYQGYGDTLPEGAHPVYCIFLTMDTDLVDVNIHPTKMQVRFSNDRTLFYLFLNSVKRALNDKGLLADIGREFEGGSAVQKVLIDDSESAPTGNSQKDLILNTFKSSHARSGRKTTQQLSLVYFKNDLAGVSGSNKEQTLSGSTENFTSDNNFDKSEVRFWQVHRKYIFAEIKSGLVIIDQHLAHARILFEKTVKLLKDNKFSASQKLLFPQKITLALDDFMVFRDIYPLLNKIGFVINVFSGNTIIIDAMPMDVKIGRESQILLDIIDYYKTTPDGDFDRFEKIAAAFAYKNALKNGEILNDREMHNLVDQLFACEYPFFSPNGKPAIVTIELDELSRRFK